MELVGEQKIPAAQPEVWRALNDPEVLKKCIPGCESIERAGDDEFRIVMLAAVGPVKARFNGSLAIRNAAPPSSYDLVFEGSGGVAGFGKGTASVALTPEGDGTLLRYTAQAQVGGRLAQVGARLIDAVARKLAVDFFGRFNEHLSGREATPQAAAVAGVKAPASAASQAATTVTSSAPAVVPATTGGAGAHVAVDTSALVGPLRVIAASAVVGAASLVGIFLVLLAI